MKLFCRLFLILPLTLAFTSCSPSSSTSSSGSIHLLSDQKTELAEKTLRDRIDSQSKGQIKLVKFTKTNGEFVAGDTVYHLFFEADIQFQADGTWLSRDMMIGLGLSYTFNPAAPSQTAMGEFANNGSGGMPVHRGDHMTLTGDMTAVKGDNGWRMDYNGEGQIKMSQSAAAN